MAATILHVSGIYAIRSEHCGRLYVGSTVNIVARWRRHACHLRRGYHHSPKLQAAWLKYGEQNFSFIALEIVEEPAFLIVREQFWLDILKAASAGFNVRHTARFSGRDVGHEVTAATREKLRLANLGKKYSDESKEKRRKWSTGRKMSPDAIAKTAAFWTGRKHSDETRAKQSEAKLRMYAAGLVHPNKGRAMSQEQKAKLTGIKRSAETRAKISEARRRWLASKA